MQITIDTNGTLSDTDLQILALLAGREAYSVDDKKVVTEPAEKPAPAKAAPAKAKPAPKVVEEPADDEDDEDEEDLLGTVTQEQVVTKVTAMVSEGKATPVKEALKKVGARKVTEIPADKLQEFWDEIN